MFNRVREGFLFKMKLSILSAVLLLMNRDSLAEDFAAVSGTGWTDISQLQSTCSYPGYFVNPSDCSRFYICVDHSTPQHSLLLRYDFDCPGGLAFDQGNKICNYPGPSGCISGGGGSGGWGWGGWSKNPTTSGVFQSSTTISKFPSWGTPTKTPVPLPGGQTIIRVPGRGGSPGGTVIRIPTASPTPLPSNPRVNLPVPSPFPQGPAGNWDSQKLPHPHHHHPVDPNVFQSIKETNLPPGAWESLKLPLPHHHHHPADPSVHHHHHPADPSVHHHHHPVDPNVFQSVKETNLPAGGWTGGPKLVTVNPGAFQSSKVTVHPTPYPWGSTQVFPTNSGAFQSVKVTQAPPAQWQTPQQFPVAPQTNVFQSTKVVEDPSGGWGRQSFAVAPSPAPANPSIPGSPFGARLPQAPPTQTVAWQATKVPGPQVSWSDPRAHPANPALGARRYPVASNPAVNLPGYAVAADPSFGLQRYAAASNPAFNLPGYSNAANPAFGPQGNPFSSPGGSTLPSPNPNIFVRGRPVASNPFTVGGQATEINPTFSGRRIPAGAAANPAFNEAGPSDWENVRITQIPSGSMWQSVKTPDSETFIGSTPTTPVPRGAAETGNFGIINQVINEEQGQSVEAAKSLVQFIYETKEQQNSIKVPAGQSPTLNQVQEQADLKDPSNNPLYEILTSRNSGTKGRIIVLYAPFSKGEKRDAPVVEVQEVADDDDNSENDKK